MTTLPDVLRNPKVESESNTGFTEVSEESLIGWMKKLHEGMEIIQRSNAANNNALTQVLDELIKLRNDVDEIKRS